MSSLAVARRERSRPAVDVDPPHGGFHLGYRPALDGLRGVAALVVVLYHSGCPFLVGGFVGVDVFFTLSGFLITALLLQEAAGRGRIDLLRFYARRALRLFPALLLLVAGYLTVSLLVSPDPWPHVFDAALVLTYVSNWTHGLGMGRPVLLGHTWSLAIEEQFYLLWPLALLLLLRADLGWRRRVAIVLGAAALSAVLRSVLLQSGADVMRIYCGLDTRADALLLGAALAMALHAGLVPHERRGANEDGSLSLAAALGLTVIAVAVSWRRPEATVFVFTLAAVLSAGLLLGVVRDPECPLARGLRAPWLVWLGRISYGIYLWHFPIVRWALELSNAWLVVAGVGCAGSIAAAYVSYRLVERPCLKLKHRFAPARTESVAAAPLTAS